MGQHKVYITILLLVSLVFTVVFNFFPRSTYSKLEKRSLTAFPHYSIEALKSGSFTKNVSSWFSDSEPFRDELMSVSMFIKDRLRVNIGEENITFHASTDNQTSTTEHQEIDLETEQRNVGEYTNNVTAEENAKIANRGIIIVGKGDKVRALMAYGGSHKGGVAYAEAANKYKEEFGDKVNVYCMVIPTAIDYYCPDKAKSCTNEEQPTINNIYHHLSENVKAVDVYTALSKHVQEDIFLRTDHHWSPLGAFYAAHQFAMVANVPFKPLTSYEKRIVHGYVGSMYGYSKDLALKNAPEDFVYYVPKAVKYTTTYTDYSVNDNYQVIAEHRPYKGIFFYKYKDGNGGAYCTFMGGDMRITKVQTSTANHRRLLILKDSFGNAIPGYLFYSFEEIHVVDYRYFTKNMKDYVRDNKITDILFANNIFNAYSNKICNKYMKFLIQTGKIDAVKVYRTHRKDSLKHVTNEVRKDSIK